MKDYTWGQVFKELARNKLIKEASLSPITLSVQESVPEEDTPWYLKTVLGISAWLSALLFILVLTQLDILNEGLHFLVAGIVLIILSLVLRLNVKSEFLVQLAFALSLAGQGSFAGGLYEASGNPQVTWLVVAIMEIVLIIIYPDFVHRFMATVATSTALVLLIYELEWSQLIHVLALLLTVLTIYIWHHESKFFSRNQDALFRPVGYGVAFSLLGLGVLSAISEIDAFDSWWIFSLILTGGIIYTTYHILDTLDITVFRGFGLGLLIGIIALLTPLMQAPGIAASVLILCLGYFRGNRILVGLCLISLALFLSRFYYSLDFTLLTKSYMLMASGVIFLVFRRILRSISPRKASQS